MQIDPGPQTIENLFGAYRHLEVPTFQRGYAWKKENLDAFLRDVKQAAEAGDAHFFGPVVLLRDRGEPRAEIVDGQQRISTVVMCLSILRDIVWEMSEHVVHAGSFQELNLRVACHQSLFNADGSQRFRAAHPIRSIFAERVIQHPPESHDHQAIPRRKLTSRGADMDSDQIRNTKELRAAWLHLNSRLRLYTQSGEIDEDSSADAVLADLNQEVCRTRIYALLNALTRDFSLYTMVLATEQDAYILFETLNDRGLRLTPSDILKTMTLRNINISGSHEDLNAALDKWDGIARNLGDWDISRFLRHFLLAVEQLPVKRSEVLDRFRKRIEAADANRARGAQKNLDALSHASLQYSTLIGVNDGEDSELDESAKRLNVLGETHRVFMLGVLQRGNATTRDQKRMLFRSAEYLHFRWTLAGKNAQVLENTYQGLLARLDASTPASEVVEQAIRSAPPDDLFRDARLDSDMLNANTDHVRYLLNRIEAGHGGNAPHWGGGTNVTLEHLAPQQPGDSSNWYTEVAPKRSDGVQYSDFVNRWGNLTMLEWKLNTAVRNSEWTIKVSGRNTRDRCIKRSTYSMNRPLAALDRWTADRINERTEWMRDQMLHLLSPAWVRTGSVTAEDWTPSA